MKTAKAKKAAPEAPAATGEHISLSSLLSVKPSFQPFRFWIVNDTPIICHAWSHKAKIEMLQKQVKSTKPGKEARDPEGDFVSSLYEMGKDKDGTTVFGFPVTGVKKAILGAAHKDKGLAKTAVMAGLWLDAAMTSVRPALAGAICDMPLVRIWGSEPAMREDMVRVGVGLNKKASLAYRAQFTYWAMRIRGRLNPTVLTPEGLAFLIGEAGLASGLGEWRNEKSGIFGAFHLASVEEEAAWDAFAAGKGSLPVPADLAMAAE